MTILQVDPVSSVLCVPDGLCDEFALSLTHAPYDQLAEHAVLLGECVHLLFGIGARGQDEDERLLSGGVRVDFVQVQVREVHEAFVQLLDYQSLNRANQQVRPQNPNH
jgi:hypothetical protein